MKLVRFKGYESWGGGSQSGVFKILILLNPKKEKKLDNHQSTNFQMKFL